MDHKRKQNERDLRNIPVGNLESFARSLKNLADKVEAFLKQSTPKRKKPMLQQFVQKTSVSKKESSPTLSPGKEKEKIDMDKTNKSDIKPP